MGTQGTAAPNRTTYLGYDANEVHFYNNGAKDNVGSLKGGYFFDLQQSIGEARHFIFIADWSFHPMMVLKRQLPAGQTEFKNADTVGFQLGEMAKRDGFLVAVHTWNHDLTAIPAALNPARDGPNDQGAVWLDRINGGKRPERLLWRASGHIGVGNSHHQKFVVMDCPVDPSNPDDPKRQLKAYMGGLDITKGRIDWVDHANRPIDPDAAPMLIKTRIDFTEKGLTGTKSKSAEFNEWYNAEFFNLEEDNADALKPDVPRQSWHDIACSVMGPTAWDLVREFVGRWNRLAGGFQEGDKDEKAIQKVLDKFAAIIGDANFAKPESPAANANARWKGRVLRSMPKPHWGAPEKGKLPDSLKGKFDWTLEESETERSIQDFYIDTIRRAERFIYIETQYFIGSGTRWRNKRDSVANTIPEAIVERTKTMIRQGKPFHTYVVMPMFPEGDPTGAAALWQRRFEFETMRYMAVSIHTEAKKNNLNWFNFVSFLFPVRWAQLPAAPSTTGDRKQRIRDNGRYMIYVHSKAMIVDDRFVIIGSANLNERSLAGDRDSEICVFLEPTKGKEADAVSQVMFFRKQIWRGLLAPRPTPPGFSDDPAWDQPESGACIRAVHGTAFRNYLYFRRGLRTVSAKLSTPDGESVQNFTSDGFLSTFPFDMVTKGLPDVKGDFGVIDTNLLKTANLADGTLSLSTIREFEEILKRKCPEGDEILPDPGGSDDKWKWSSATGSALAAGLAE
jgi:phospholipase D1/2